MNSGQFRILLFFSVAGALLLTALSAAQKLIIGVPLTTWSGYAVPILFGCTGGLAVGVWFRRAGNYAQSLRENEARFRATFEQAAVGIAHLAPDGRFIRVNRPLCDFLGYPQEELLGRSFQSISHPGELDVNLDYVQRMLAGDIESYNLEKRYLRKDGQTIWGHVTVSLVRDQEKRPAYFLAVCKDVTERKSVYQALQRERDFTDAVLDTVASLVIVMDRSGGIVRFNRSCEALTGYRFEEIKGRYPWDFLLPPEDIESVRGVFDDLSAGRFPNHHRNEWVTRDGARRMIDWSNTAFTDERGAVSHVIATGTDITDRLQAEREFLRVSENNRLLLESAGEGIFGIDERGRCTFINRAGQEMLGYGREELQGCGMHELVHHTRTDGSPYPARECTIFRALLKKTGARVADELFWRKDGTSFPVEYSAYPLREDQRVSGAVVVFRNVAEAQAMARRMDYLATHDALTGLSNRYAFERHLLQALEHAAEEHVEHVLCYLDLDQFKVVNDTCGHVAGDELLRQLSTLLHNRVRQGDVLGRLGGDEFGVLLEGCPMDQAMRVVNELLATVQDFRFVWEDKTFSVGLSIGMVAIDENTESAAAALSEADTACYAAKESGRNRIHVYAASDLDLVRRHGEMHWVASIHQAYEEQRFFLRTQPIVPVSGLSTPGRCFEVLIGMRDSDGHYVPPGAFLPAAERYNLMPTMDRWVVRSAFDWLASSETRRARLDFCTINLSGTTLADEYFQEFLFDQFQSSGIPPQKVCFEITETAAIANLSRAVTFMTALKKIGCRFALDDFGSGMSSFAYLKTLPVDFLKIDGGFVRDIVTDPVDRAMVEAINQVGQVMALYTIAEHVENQAILQVLQEIGVDYVQGYEVGRPEPLGGR